MSYRERVTFSMIASEDEQHYERLSFIHDYQLKVLPIAAIYGGNASGKSNFLKALRFVKKLVGILPESDSPIPIEPFSLSLEYNQQPTRFTLEILVDHAIYEFSFTLNHKDILEEKLLKTSNDIDEIVYTREGDNIQLNENYPFLVNSDYLNFVSQSTKNNQLFLSNAVFFKVEGLKPISDWFKDTLKTVFPESSPSLIEDQLDHDHPLYSYMNSILERLDTGIVQLKYEDIPIENLPISVNLFASNLKEGGIFPFGSIHLFRKGGELKAKKQVAYHRTLSGDEIKFDIEQESNGTRRLIELLPAFLQLSNSSSPIVYAIDEIDNSLHTVLTRTLLEEYLAICGAENRSQLLFTTHDVLQIDKELLRTDEMWVTERKTDGSTTLYSFSDYEEARQDEDIRNSYLQGRLGGIPNLLLSGELKNLKKKK